MDETFSKFELTINGVFHYKLSPAPKSDCEVIREELAAVKAEKLQLLLDHKLFQHYFFNFWRERSRDILLEKQYLLDSIIESPQNLYNMCEAMAFGHSDSHHAAHEQGALIGFKQPVAFLYHTGAARCEEQIIVRTGEGEDVFEVFISGRQFSHHLGRISSRVTREERSKDGQLWYLHKCDLQLLPS